MERTVDNGMLSDANPFPVANDYANRHVKSFLKMPEHDLDSSSSNNIQIIYDGKQLTANKLLNNTDITLSRPILVRDTPESIGMKVLKFPKRQVTVADIAAIIGETYPLHVIDVEHQEELEGWTLGDLVDYFEDEARLFQPAHDQELIRKITTEASPTTGKRRRKAAEKALLKTGIHRPRVLNQISLEFSKTPLRSRIQSPQFVRDIDWIDNAWPRRPNEREAEVFPNVQYYCLTSAGGSYTDFHIDFGGTSVWYHVLSGEKNFCLIPPSKDNLARYEEWLCRPDQATTFLPDIIPVPNDIIRISLQSSQTLVIPTAWIHAVYTPTDSVVIGGNFLHGMEMKKQLVVHCIESRTKVQEKFRFPFFLPLHFYAGGMYLEKLRRGDLCKQEVDGLHDFVNALDSWWKVQNEQSQSQLQPGPTVASAANEAAKRNSCSTVEDFLVVLRKEHARVLAHGISPNNEYSPPASPAKPKLKLKLKSQESLPKVAPPKPEPDNPKSHTPKPKLRLKLKNDLSPKFSSSDNANDKFRIVVSSTAIEASTASMPQPKPKRVREDTAWIDDGLVVDDDWMPPMKSKQKKRESGGERQGRIAKAKPQTKPPSARQRLMKRFH